MAQLLDGDYKDQLEYIKMQFPIEDPIVDNSSVKMIGASVKIKKYFLRYFTRFEESGCIANGTFYLNKEDSKTVSFKIELNSERIECFPKYLTIISQSGLPPLISAQRMKNFTIIIFMSLCFFCYSMIRQMKVVEESENIAKRISVTTIGWNIIWNFAFFNIYFSYSVLTTANSMLMAPAFFYFMI